MTQAVDVIFTGQIRDQEIFRTNLERVRGGANIGRVLLASWEDEILTHWDFLQSITADFALELVASGQPPFVSGYYMHQVKSLVMALDQLAPHARVLKTRPDVAMSAKLFENGLPPGSPAGHMPGFPDPVLAEKIHVIGWTPTIPFYVHDLILLGRAQDLRSISHFNSEYDYYFNLNTTGVHTRRFVEPFRKSYPAFDGLLPVWALFGPSTLHVLPYANGITPALLDTPALHPILALAQIVLENHFSTDWNLDGAPIAHLRGAALPDETMAAPLPAALKSAVGDLKQSGPDSVDGAAAARALVDLARKVGPGAIPNALRNQIRRGGLADPSFQVLRLKKLITQDHAYDDALAVFDRLDDDVVLADAVLLCDVIRTMHHPQLVHLAIHMANRLCDVAPEYPFTHYCRALAYDRAGQTGLARRALWAAIEQNYFDENLFLLIAQLFEKDGDKAMAAKMIMLGRTALPDSVKLRNRAQQLGLS